MAKPRGRGHHPRINYPIRNGRNHSLPLHHRQSARPRFEGNATACMITVNAWAGKYELMTGEGARFIPFAFFGEIDTGYGYAF